MWAYLQTTTGTNFLALSLHTDNAKTPQSELGRVLLGKSLAAWVQQLNVLSGMEGTRAILMADLNSYQRRQPAGAQAQLVSQGWVDSHTAKSRRNIEYSTINYNPLLGNEQGFPSKPYKFRPTRKNPKGEATRIDYVMGYGTGIRALDYEVVIRLRPGGEFDPEYQASDHQMVRAVLALT